MLLDMAGGSTFTDGGSRLDFIGGGYEAGGDGTGGGAGEGQPDLLFPELSSMLPMDSMTVDFHAPGAFGGMDMAGLSEDCQMHEGGLWM